MAPRATFEAEGAAEMQKLLRGAGKDARKKLRAAGKEVGQVVVTEAQSRARRSLRMQSSAARQLKAGATLKGGTVRIVNSARVPYALAAFMGVRGRRGWYASPRYSGKGADQFPAWVGNQYTAGTRNGGPYHVNVAIAVKLDEVADVFLDRVTEAFKDAGLDVSNN